VFVCCVWGGCVVWCCGVGVVGGGGGGGGWGGGNSDTVGGKQQVICRSLRRYACLQAYGNLLPGSWVVFSYYRLCSLTIECVLLLQCLEAYGNLLPGSWVVSFLDIIRVYSMREFCMRALKPMQIFYQVGMVCVTYALCMSDVYA